MMDRVEVIAREIAAGDENDIWGFEFFSNYFLDRARAVIAALEREGYDIRRKGE